MRPREQWHQIEDEKQAGQALVAVARKFKDRRTARKSRATSLLSLYEGLSLGSYGPSAYDDAEPFSYASNGNTAEAPGLPVDQLWNLGASIMDALDAKLFQQRAKTAFVTSNGGWEAKRAGVLGGRFVEGVQSEPQGIFQDSWAMWRHGARIAMTSTGGCMVWFWSDPDEGKIVMELDDTLSTWVETSGLAYDGVSAIGRISYWDPEKLAAKYPEHEAEIFSAAEKPDDELREITNFDDELPPDDVLRVPLIQGFRMKAPGVKGVRLIAIPGATLERDEYDYDYPPCVHFCPMRQLAGYWGKPLLDRISKPLEYMNQMVASLCDAERLTPKGAVVYNPTATPPATLANIKNVVLIPHNGPMEMAPRYDAPAPFNPVVLEWLKEMRQMCYDLIGVTEATVTAGREKGLSSGVAIRLVQEQTHERFAPVEEEYARCVGPESAKQIIRCAQEIQKKGKFTATWKGGDEHGFLREIPADVFDVLEKYKYRVEPQVVSGNVNTPADRVELAEELVQAGIITGDAYATILQTYDTVGATGSDISAAEEQFTERQIDQWLYSEEDELEESYMGPEKWFHQEERLLQVGSALLHAKIQQCPPERLLYFYRYMAELQLQLDEKQQRQAQLQATASGQAPAPAAPPAPEQAAPPAPPMAA
jgi:hypothetical protein